MAIECGCKPYYPCVDHMRMENSESSAFDLQEILRDHRREIARLRAVLEWMARRADVRGDGIAHDCGDAALRGDWDAVRAAGVALGEDNE